MLLLGMASPLHAAPVPPAPGPDGGFVAGHEPPPVPAALNDAARARLRTWFDRDAEVGRERATGTVNWLVILVAFADTTFADVYTEELDPLGVLGETDVIETPRTEWFENELQHVDDYFRTISHDRLSVDYTLVAEPVQLTGDMADYGTEEGSWTQLMREMVAEAVAEVDDVIDFALYDLVSLIHVGAGQESDLQQDSTDQIWSGYIDYASLTAAFADSIPETPTPGFPAIATDDAGGTHLIQRFGILPEVEVEEGMDPDYVLGTLGVYVHQVASYIGLLSLNDTTTPRGQGAGNFDLMSSGLWNALGFVPGPPSAFNRMLMGWDDAALVEREACLAPDPDGGLELSLPSCEQSADTVLLKFPISDREYFLFANRNQDADGNGAFSFDDANGNHMPDNAESLYGAEFDYYTTQANASDLVPGSGLFVWRIDEEMVQLTFRYDINLINAYNDHYGVLLLEADGAFDLTVRGFDANAYGSDVDAFRSGENGLQATQTRIDGTTYPSTRSAEGAESGWSFHDIGGHGERMSFVARWEPGWDIDSITLSDLTPAGDPVLADLAADPADRSEFAFAARDAEDRTHLFVCRDGVPLLEDDIDHPQGAMAIEEGLSAGSPVAGDITASGTAELVLLLTDGHLKAWTESGGDWLSLAGGHVPGALNRVTAARVSPVLLDIDDEPGLEILVAEHLPGDETTPDSTCLRWFDANGDEIAPEGLEAIWPVRIAGAMVGDMSLGWETPTSERGYDHPAPDGVFVNACVVDTTGGAVARVHRIQCVTSAAWSGLEELRVRSMEFAPGGDANVDLRSGDLDGDGCDELLVETPAAVLFWYPAGRFDGDLAGETLFAADDLTPSVTRSLAVLDLNGDGALEALGCQPSEAAAWTADAHLLSDWPIAWPQTAPSPSNFYDPALWTFFVRDANGVDSPAIVTKDGRLLRTRDGIARGDAVLLGGNVAGRPLPGLPADGDHLLLHGLSAFDAVAGVTTGEDSLLIRPTLRYWRAETDWSAAGAESWLSQVNDPTGGGRVAAANSVTVASAGSRSFDAAYAYPNPAGETVNWRVACDSPDHFTIRLFDLEGQKRLELNGFCDGINPWERESRLVGLASGVYLYTIRSDDTDRQSVGRLAIIR